MKKINAPRVKRSARADRAEEHDKVMDALVAQFDAQRRQREALRPAREVADHG